MKKITRLFLCLLLTLSLAVPAAAAPASYPSQMRFSSRKAVKILMIGNSYTWFNKMPEMLEKISSSAGVKTKVTSVTCGGASLKHFADKSTRIGRRVNQLLKSQKWDYVILQDRHFYPIAYPERLYDAVLDLKPRIEAAGAKTVLFMTWAPYGYSKDYSMYKNVVKGRENYQKQVQEIYETTAKEANALVVPAGLSVTKADKADIVKRLLRRDGSHPNYAGSYVTACTIFKTLFPNSSDTITYYGRFASRPRTARALQRIAIDTAQNYQQPNKETKTETAFSWRSLFLSLLLLFIRTD